MRISSDYGTAVAIPALGPEGDFVTRARIPIANCVGLSAFSLSSIPGPVASYWIDSIRSTRTLPPSSITAVLKKAADIFESRGAIGASLDDFEHGLSLLTGTPITVIRECNRLIVDTLRNAQPRSQLAVPVACLTPGELLAANARTGAAWSRKGEIFAVLAAGNSPGVHAMWLEALALGYKVVVRPSNRDPLTPHRLITALRLAGVATSQVVLIPCDYAVADLLVERADLSLVYGGQNVVDRFRNRSDVRVQGPGRSKLVVTINSNEDVAYELAVEGALYHAGTACTSTTGILVEKDAHGFAKRLSERLRRVAPAEPRNDQAQLPCMVKEQAERLVNEVLTLVPENAVSLKPEIVDIAIGTDRTATITPAVVELRSCEDPLLARELPFPCVWVAPFEREKLHVLRDSLVLSIATSEIELLHDALTHTGVSNVYQNKPTSWTQPGVPHDSFLGEFLMRTKGVSYG
jgi:acyl-CoA reductase-like NAD-dependent aldehyde dehydrogenase